MNPLFCFQHCTKDNIFCFALPSKCPICQDELSTASFRIPLFRLPNPISKARGCPNSIVVKPAAGHSFQNYAFGDDLHVGLTDSRGTLFEYDYQGLLIHNADGLFAWDSCVTIPVIKIARLCGNFDGASWSARLDKTTRDARWLSSRYDESEFNCFTYALDVLNSYCLENWDKVSLCREVVLPAIRRAVKYTRLYEQVAQNAIYVQMNPEGGQL